MLKAEKWFDYGFGLGIPKLMVQHLRLKMLEMDIHLN